MRHTYSQEVAYQHVVSYVSYRLLTLVIEVRYIVSNVGSNPYTLGKGDRIGQLVITPVVIADFVTEKGEERGTGAFASTGK